MNPEEFLYHGYVIRKSKDGTFHAFPTTTFSVFHGGTLTEVLNKVGDYVLFNKGKPEQKTDGIFRHETDEYKEAWNQAVKTEEKIREEMKIPNDRGRTFFYRGYRVEEMADGLLVASPVFGSVSDMKMIGLVYKINAELRRTEAMNGTITGIKFDTEETPEGKS